MRKKKDMSDSVLSKSLIRSMGCHLDTVFDTSHPVVHGWSLDSATGDLDRNILTHFADGICNKTGLWKVHIFEAVSQSRSEVHYTITSLYAPLYVVFKNLLASLSDVC